MESATQAPHVVIFPFPAQGHITPALQLAKKLASQGLSITFLNTHYHISKLMHSHSTTNVRLMGLPDGLPEDHGDAYNNIPFLASATEKMGPVLEHLLLLLITSSQNDWPPPLCIITDVFFGWAQDVADKLNLPRFIFFTPPAACLVLMLHLQSLISQKRLPWNGDPAELLGIPGITSSVRISDVPSHLLLDPSAFMYGYFIRHSNRIRDASGILLNTFYELEKDAIDAATTEFLSQTRLSSQKRPLIIPVGPLLPFDIFQPNSDSNRSDDHEAIRWLNTQSIASVIYVSFGSIAVHSNAQLHEMALGLEASGRPFLWVVRPANDSSMADPEEVLPAGFTARTSGRGKVISWAPQLEVLCHPSIGGFLSHCGWNSTLEGICTGVPMVCWPMGAEQKLNCRFLVDKAKAGLEVAKNRDGFVEMEALKSAIRQLMKEEGNQGEDSMIMKRNMQELRHAAERASCADQHHYLHQFVEHIRNLQTCPPSSSSSS